MLGVRITISFMCPVFAFVLLFLKPSFALEQEIILELPDGEQIEFVLIPAGSFLMGSSQEEIDSLNTVYYQENLEANAGFLYPPDMFSNEGPQHEVTLTQPFYISKTEITQGQWFAVMKREPSFWKQSLGSYWYLGRSADSPVGGIEWEEANAFATALRAFDLISRYRLPTEAEWEYAARAGSETPWSFGNNLDQLEEHMTEPCSAVGISSISCAISSQVGMKQPNPWGLFDVHGGVWEWVQDWYQADYYSRSPRVDPTGPEIGESHAIRGGSSGVRWKWTGFRSFEIVDGAQVRSAIRNPIVHRSINIGFRLVKEIMLPTTAPQKSWGQIKAQQKAKVE